VGVVTADEAASVGRWLLRNGFEQTRHQQRPDHFGDEFTEWCRDGMLVSTTRDRGHWFVEVARVGWHEWFDVDLVAGVLGDKSGALLERVAITASAADQMDRLRPVLAEVRRERSANRQRRTES